MYLIALLLPPIAIVMCSKYFQAIANVMLLMFSATVPMFYFPVVVHALLVVHNYHREQQHQELMRTISPEYAHAHPRKKEWYEQLYEILLGKPSTPTPPPIQERKRTDP